MEIKSCLICYTFSMIFLHVNGTFPGFTKSDKEKDYPRLGKRIPIWLVPQPSDQRYNFNPEYNPEDRPDPSFILQQAQRLLRTKFGTIDPENTIALTFGGDRLPFRYDLNMDNKNYLAYLNYNRDV